MELAGAFVGKVQVPLGFVHDRVRLHLLLQRFVQALDACVLESSAKVLQVSLVLGVGRINAFAGSPVDSPLAVGPYHLVLLCEQLLCFRIYTLIQHVNELGGLGIVARDATGEGTLENLGASPALL
eukprot:2672312-Rhodomonas_salina.1